MLMISSSFLSDFVACSMNWKEIIFLRFFMAVYFYVWGERNDISHQTLSVERKSERKTSKYNVMIFMEVAKPFCALPILLRSAIPSFHSSETFKHGIIIIIMFVSENGGSNTTERKFYSSSMYWRSGEMETSSMACIFLSLPSRSDSRISRARYIMPRLYIGKQYWKAYDNNIKRSKKTCWKKSQCLI